MPKSTPDKPIRSAKKASSKLPPTLSRRARSAPMGEVCNCRPADDEVEPAHRSVKLDQGGWSMLVSRIRGLATHEDGPPVEFLRFSRFPLTQEQSDEDEELAAAVEEAGFDSSTTEGYAPGLTYEGGKSYFGGSMPAAKALFDAVELAICSDPELAKLACSMGPDDMAFGAALWTWPEADAGAVAVFDTILYDEQRELWRLLPTAIERVAPGVLGAMESRQDLDFSAATAEFYDEELAEGMSERVVMAHYDSEPDVQALAASEPLEADGLGPLRRMLERREIARSAAAAPSKSKRKRI